MNRFIADTTVVLEMLRGNTKALRFLETRPEISLVTVAELIQGARDKENFLVVEKLCKLLPQLEIDGKISVKAIELMKKYSLSHGLMFLDALIAASAIVRKRILVTANMKDFKFIAGLQAEAQEELFKDY